MKKILLLFVMFSIIGAALSGCEPQYGPNNLGYSCLGMTFVNEDGESLITNNMVYEQNKHGLMALNPDLFRLTSIKGEDRRRLNPVDCFANDKGYYIWIMYLNTDAPIIHQTFEIQCAALFADEDQHRIEVTYSQVSEWDSEMSGFTIDGKECPIENGVAIITIETGR